MAKRDSIYPWQGPSNAASTPALRTGGFTLIELILVMMILAISAAILVPSLRGFTVGRSTENAATLILSVSNYARSQAVSEGRNYRLNFDSQAGNIWLTMQDTGGFIPPSNDFGQRFPLPSGLVMSVNVVPQSNTQLAVTTDVQQITSVPILPYGQPIANGNSQVQNQHAGGTYIEFQPSGRADPAHIQLTDKLGKRIDLGNASATESLHILTAGELQ